MHDTETPSEVTSQAEEYLEAICRILERGDNATPKALATELSVAPPSVLGMFRRLEEQSLISYSRQTGAMLTDRGRFYAERLRRRHRLAERLLTDLLGMPAARAHDVACRFEHVIDDEVEGYLMAALKHPTTCPHGNPLNGQNAATDGWTPLSALAPGTSGILRSIINESGPMLAYLTAVHLYPETTLTVCDIAPFFDGPFTIEVDGERIALSRSVANHLLIEVTGERL